jgi:hypothetical protein
VYTDGHAVFQPRRGPGELPQVCRKGGETQWSRALSELGITQILAHSPEAKGRVERANGTFQDRLVAELRLAGASTVEEANQVLTDFLPQFNQRFGVPAAQQESAYRPIDPELDLGSVLCIKELRRVAKDNTVQYHGRTLQLFPDQERPSYAGVRVEVQERLDGNLLVRHQGKFLSPVDAPPLAAQLRNRVPTGPVTVTLPDPTDWSPTPRVKAPVIPGPLAGDPIWYEDPTRKQLHRDLVKGGMERARQQGKRIGRPQVRERHDFDQGFIQVVERIGPEGITRTQAARELGIGYATLKRLLDAQGASRASTELS